MTRKKLSTLLRVAVAAAVVALTGAAALAQQDDFVTMTPEQMAQAQESLPAAPLVYAAYAVAWVALLGYVLVLWRKQSRLEDELRRLRARFGDDR